MKCLEKPVEEKVCRKCALLHKRTLTFFFMYITIDTVLGTRLLLEIDESKE